MATRGIFHGLGVEWILRNKSTFLQRIFVAKSKDGALMEERRESLCRAVAATAEGAWPKRGIWCVVCMPCTVGRTDTRLSDKMAVLPGPVCSIMSVHPHTHSKSLTLRLQPTPSGVSTPRNIRSGCMVQSRLVTWPTGMPDHGIQGRRMVLVVAPSAILSGHLPDSQPAVSVLYPCVLYGWSPSLVAVMGARYQVLAYLPGQGSLSRVI